MNENQCCGGSLECINEETPSMPQDVAPVTHQYLSIVLTLNL